MIELEEKALELSGKEKELTELYNALEIEKLSRQVVGLEEQTAKEGFWDDPQNSQKILKEISAIKAKINLATSDRETLIPLYVKKSQAEEESKC